MILMDEPVRRGRRAQTRTQLPGRPAAALEPEAQNHPFFVTHDITEAIALGDRAWC